MLSFKLIPIEIPFKIHLCIYLRCIFSLGVRGKEPHGNIYAQSFLVVFFARKIRSASALLFTFFWERATARGERIRTKSPLIAFWYVALLVSSLFNLVILSPSLLSVLRVFRSLGSAKTQFHIAKPTVINCQIMIRVFVALNVVQISLHPFDFLPFVGRSSAARVSIEINLPGSRAVLTSSQWSREGHTAQTSWSALRCRSVSIQLPRQHLIRSTTNLNVWNALWTEKRRGKKMQSAGEERKKAAKEMQRCECPHYAARIRLIDE